MKFWLSGKKKKLLLNTVKIALSLSLALKSYIDSKHIRCSKQVVVGSRIDKLKQITKYTHECFVQAINNLKSVHDIDLKRWPMKKNNKLGSVTGFTASNN